MSMDDTFSEHAPTVSPQIRTLRLVEHVKPEQEQAYLEWSREFSDAHANFIAARDPESWSSVVMIRDRAFGRNEVRYIKVFRFPDDAIFEAWVASDERREMIRKGQALNFAVDESALERAPSVHGSSTPTLRHRRDGVPRRALSRRHCRDAARSHSGASSGRGAPRRSSPSSTCLRRILRKAAPANASRRRVSLGCRCIRW